MIEKLGFTADGKVFMTLGITVDNKPLKGTLIMEPDLAEKVSRDLSVAVSKAREAIKKVGS